MPVPLDDLPSNLVPESDLPGRKTPKQMKSEAPTLGEKAWPYIKTLGHMAIPGGAGFKAMQIMSEGAYDAGGAVTDVGAKIGLSPKVSAGMGFGTNVALQSIPMLAGGQIGGKIGEVPLKAIGRDLMQSALKPTLKQLKSGNATTAIDTMLEMGLNATRGGVQKIKNRIGDLNDQIAEAITKSGATISKSEVGKSLINTLEKFKNQVNPNADVQAVRNAWLEFKNHPLLKDIEDIPVQLAQRLKQGTYKQLSKKYGQLGSAEIEAQKGIARGLKEGVAKAVPGIGHLNKQESDLIKTLDVAERRSLMELNKNPVGLSLLTHRPALFAAYMADKSALFKSLVGRMAYSGSEVLPQNVSRGGISLYEMSQQP